MQLSKREGIIIDLLLKNGLSLTANQLADFANVSTKTIYRTVKKINEASESGKVIKSEPGKGLILDYDRFLKENAKSGGDGRITEPVERRHNIMLSLLFKSPNKVEINHLFEPYYVSDTAISGDLQKMGDYLAAYHIQLKRSRKKLYIEGTERSIRKAVLSIIAKNNLIDDVFTASAQLVNSYDIDFITVILDFIDKKMQTTIAYPYNVNIFSHIYILVQRVRQGKILQGNNDELDHEEKKLINSNNAFYEVSKQVIKKISVYLNVDLPNSEVFYLFQYLISSRIDNQTYNGTKNREQAKKIAEAFLKEISSTLKITLIKQANIMNLLRHIEPLLYRLENEIVIKNGILKDILLEYPEMFQTVRDAARHIEQANKLACISDDEIGFLTLYFVKYKEISQKQKRILIMCSSGIGTSELLKVKVQRAFSNVKIVDVLSSRLFQKNIDKYKNIDLILTTIHLNKSIPIPSVLVNSVFTKQDEERVKQLLGGI
ncbi:BglG family transcription antiterminator [Amphibacillus cookii]|uniref:BglG family transcription antiterminator n=1 Tax=Amphibacillus cookii TaxID=767787 RepID=UPI00195A0957|nr:PRD domain-containing protein [Amphibacillus cookii]MBM7542816.1 activator of the mannose operon (transcriptional antiterminator) [Amphibacillus cookii]